MQAILLITCHVKYPQLLRMLTVTYVYSYFFHSTDHCQARIGLHSRQIPPKVSIHIRLWEFPAFTKNYTKDAKQHTQTHMSSAMTSAAFTFNNDLLRDAIDQSRRVICEWCWTVQDYGNTLPGEMLEIRRAKFECKLMSCSNVLNYFALGL